MKVMVTLREIIHAGDKAINHFGLDPYCLAEGVDGDSEYKIDYETAKELNLVPMEDEG